MFNAHRYTETSWAGEPETDPTSDVTDPVEGWELTPFDCIEMAHGAVLRDRYVVAGAPTTPRLDSTLVWLGRLKYCVYLDLEHALRSVARSQVCLQFIPDLGLMVSQPR